MPNLVLGPLLRYVGESEATVWVETDAACEVEALGQRSRTFEVAGHHYALVAITGLARGSTQPYGVALDGERRWPERFPPSEIRTLPRGEELRLAFGSCRVCAPHTRPDCLGPDEDAQGLGVDALYPYALRMLAQPGRSRPHLLLLLGDQVYADEVSPTVRSFIRTRRGSGEPADEVADFEEYTQLYREAWGHPLLRWLLSTVPTAMVFDDHDLHDDWNTSEAWVAQMRAKPWWEERTVGALMSYWIYQHLGNLSPAELVEDELFQLVTSTGDGTQALREFARKASHETDGSRWSYAREFGPSTLVVIDSRAGRVLRDGQRSMLDEEEWGWLERHATGDVDHLLLATSLPLLLTPGFHYLEAWNEAVCAGAWGRVAAAFGEQLRQRLDLEHWAAFQESFLRFVRIIEAVARGERGAPPESIVVLSGDVHHAYLAEVAFPRSAQAQSSVYQAVCSPFRHPLGSHERRAVSAAMSTPAAVATRALARAAGVAAAPVRWRLTERPIFDNQIGTLKLARGEARLMVETAAADSSRPKLELAIDRQLAPRGAGS
jgi:hypothetical protein